jgi:hypothetical protein
VLPKSIKLNATYYTTEVLALIRELSKDHGVVTQSTLIFMLTMLSALRKKGDWLSAAQ